MAFFTFKGLRFLDKSSESTKSRNIKHLTLYGAYRILSLYRVPFNNKTCESGW